MSHVSAGERWPSNNCFTRPDTGRYTWNSRTHWSGRMDKRVRPNWLTIWNKNYPPTGSTAWKVRKSCYHSTDPIATDCRRGQVWRWYPKPCISHPSIQPTIQPAQQLAKLYKQARFPIVIVWPTGMERPEAAAGRHWSLWDGKQTGDNETRQFKLYDRHSA